MKVILAVDRNFAIGKDGDMLFSIPEDMQRFKELTTGNIVIMGRKTLESLPDSKPLPNRTNIIITSKDLDGMLCVKNEEELLRTLKEINPDHKMTEYLIGGANTIESLIHLVDEFVITYVDAEFEYDAKIRNLFEDQYVSDGNRHYTFDTNAVISFGQGDKSNAHQHGFGVINWAGTGNGSIDMTGHKLSLVADGKNSVSQYMRANGIIVESETLDINNIKGLDINIKNSAYSSGIYVVGMPSEGAWDNGG